MKRRLDEQVHREGREWLPGHAERREGDLRPGTDGGVRKFRVRPTIAHSVPRGQGVPVWICVGLLSVAACLVAGCGGGNPAKVWFVSDTPLTETLDLEKRIGDALPSLLAGRNVQIKRLQALGDANRMAEILAAADKSADVVVAMGADAASGAWKICGRVPVVYCEVPYAGLYEFGRNNDAGRRFGGVSEEPPVDRYCAELKRVEKEWEDVGVILPQGHRGAQQEMQVFGEQYKREFGREVKAVLIDGKTCAQLMDVVGAYNVIASEKVGMYYAIDDGNLAKYVGMLVRQCTQRSLPVIGGGRAVLEQGGLLALVPNEGALASQCAVLIAKALRGEEYGCEKVRKFETLWNTNAIAELALRFRE